MAQSKKLIGISLLGCALVLTLVFFALDLSWWWPLITILLLAGCLALTMRQKALGQRPDGIKTLAETYTQHPAYHQDLNVTHKDLSYHPATAVVIEHIVSLVLTPLMGSRQQLEQCFQALSAEILRQTMMEAKREQQKFYERRAAERASALGRELTQKRSNELTHSGPDPLLPGLELEAEVKQHLLNCGVHPQLISAAMSYAKHRVLKGQVKAQDELKWFELRPNSIGMVLSYLKELTLKPEFYGISPELCAYYRQLYAELAAMC